MRHRFRLSTKAFVAFSLLAAVALGAVVVTLVTVRSAKQSVERMADMTLVMRRQALTDTQRDTLRSIVFIALHDGGKKSAANSDAAKDLEKTVADFEKNIADIPEKGVSKDVAAAKPELVSLAKVYTGKVRAIVGLAFTDPPAAEMKLPSFEVTFEDLAAAMQKMGDLIQAANDEIEREAHAAEDRLQITSVLSGAVILASLLSPSCGFASGSSAASCRSGRRWSTASAATGWNSSSALTPATNSANSPRRSEASAKRALRRRGSARRWTTVLST